ncbi:MULTISPECIES: GntR family transcriptional regulator [unclassified Sporolactobacillus]|uniref:GntR family transcriptional regulator n=1 Tax=unclassified Sporolactobacillus TaxID=2628533 RepID=UPI0023680F7D|nr:GntR family transcriptional regulator [Sporolactobacillus sp. CQH2019]MDD9148327.1 GntR family transcriptional regulator [Sporolactobacillus sp. CQH2019]
MAETFNPSVPIYLQLGERIKNRIIRGEIGVGERLPSVRDLAIASGVNPNTVQRTYRELEEEGIVEKRRGQGTYVTENQEALGRMRNELKKRHISAFVCEMNEMGYSEAEMLEGLKHYFDENSTGEGRQ